MSESWLPAEIACEVDGAGAHLVIVDDLNELSSFYMLVGVNSVWIGATDRLIEGQYRQVTGPVQTYLPWAPSEPTSEDCLVASVNADLSDRDCNEPLRYLCECDGVAADPSSY